MVTPEFKELDELRKYLDENNKMYLLLLYSYEKRGIHSEAKKRELELTGSVTTSNTNRKMAISEKAVLSNAPRAMGVGDNTFLAARTGKSRQRVQLELCKTERDDSGKKV